MEYFDLLLQKVDPHITMEETESQCPHLGDYVSSVSLSILVKSTEFLFDYHYDHKKTCKQYYPVRFTEKPNVRRQQGDLLVCTPSFQDSTLYIEYVHETRAGNRVSQCNVLLDDVALLQKNWLW